MLDINRNQPVPGRSVVGAEIQFIADVANQGVVMVKAFDEHYGFGGRIGQVLVDNGVAIVGTHCNRDNQVFAIFSDTGTRAPVRKIRSCVNHPVLFLGCYQLVKEDRHILVQRLEFFLLFCLGIAAVVKA